MRLDWRSFLTYLAIEPAPLRPYVHPSQYRVVENVRHYSDGMHKLYTPSLFTRALAAVTLGLYIGVPHLLLCLLLASYWWRPAGWALLALLATLALPARPLRLQRVLSAYLFLAWRRYFTFSYLFEKSLDCYQDYIIAQFPHGAFPLGAVVGGSFMATQYPEYTCYALAASSAFYVPVWRHVHAWLGTQTCTKANFHELLGRGVFGPQPRQSARRSSASATAGTSSGDMGAGTGSGMVLRRRASKMAPPAQAMSAQKCRSTSVDDSGMGTAANATGVGSLQLQSRPSARRSLTDSLRASLRGQHTLSDTESSDSDAAEACTACISSRASMTPLSRFSSIERRSCDAQPSQSAPWPLDPVTGRRRTGVSVGLMVGGIAEMFMIRPDHERIKLLDRKGFVRVAVERGVPILPVYMFGANQALDFGPPWLARLSRRLRASVGVMYGVWGLPVPRRVPIFKVSGRPLDVGPPMPKDDPGFAARVDAVHAAFVVEIQRIYYEHRGKYGCGFENRPLVIC